MFRGLFLYGPLVEQSPHVDKHYLHSPLRPFYTLNTGITNVYLRSPHFRTEQVFITHMRTGLSHLFQRTLCVHCQRHDGKNGAGIQIA